MRAQLIDAATEIMAEAVAPEVLTLREVARRVGVSPASIYGHFKDIDALIETVLGERFAELTALTDAAVSGHPDALGRLVARCWTYVSWGLDYPGHYRVVFGGRARDTGNLPDVDHGDSLLDALVIDLRAAKGDMTGVSGTEMDRFSGILLWTALHGIVALTNDKFEMALPPPTDLVAHTVARHVDVHPLKIDEVLRSIRSAVVPSKFDV